MTVIKASNPTWDLKSDIQQLIWIQASPKIVTMDAEKNIWLDFPKWLFNSSAKLSGFLLSRIQFVSLWV